MAFIIHQAGDVKEGRLRELQEWLAANEKELANSMPPDARYLGTYFAIYHSDKTAGAVHTLIEIESYGTQDVLAEMGRGDTVLARLTNELFDFFEANSTLGTNALYKKVTDATIYGE